MEWIVKPFFDSKGYQRGYEVIQMLTRCKNCKYWDVKWIPAHGTSNEHYCPQTDIVTDANFFCKDGSPIGPGIEDKT